MFETRGVEGGGCILHGEMRINGELSLHLNIIIVDYLKYIYILKLLQLLLSYNYNNNIIIITIISNKKRLDYFNLNILYVLESM